MRHFASVLFALGIIHNSNGLQPKSCLSLSVYVTHRGLLQVWSPGVAGRGVHSGLDLTNLCSPLLTLCILIAQVGVFL